MIGWLDGVVRRVEPDGVIVLAVSGVGYEVRVARHEHATLSDGVPVELFVHTHVREGESTLYGFRTPEERHVFRVLLQAPGIGPTTALGALGTMPLDALTRAVAMNDVDTIATIPGIGKKTASRLVLELSGKLVLPDLESATTPRADGTVEHALRSLGFSANEIRDALAGVTLPEEPGRALRVALRALGAR